MTMQKPVVSLTILLLMVSLTTANMGVKSLTSANTRFGHTIFKTVGPKYDNLVFSPYSLHSALTMTANGAQGDTLQEMKTTLGISTLTEAVVNQAYMDLISSFNATGDVDVLTGNAIFQNPKFSIMQAFKDLVADKYYAMAEMLNFTAPGGAEKMINDYVAEKTNDMIQNLFQMNSLDADSTKLVLVNTIFFNGSWEMPFDKTETKEEDFHVSSTEKMKVDMMMQEKYFHMKFEDDYKSLRLPFTQNRFALYVVVPNNTDHVMNPACLPMTAPDEYFTGLNNTKAKVYVPKFEINYKQSLPPLLKQLGMKKAFTTDADFSKISPNTMLSEVLHQAVIEVTESGTTAAAATAVVAVVTSIQFPQELPEFRVDRPFFFYLRDDLHKEILFQGKFSRPMADASTFVQEVQRNVPTCDDGGDGAATLSLALFGWILSLSFSLLHLSKAIN